MTKRLLFGVGILAAILVVAAIGILLYIPYLLDQRVLSGNSRVRNDMRTMATAVESYAVDNGELPPPDIDTDGRRIVPSLLTTPTAYLFQNPTDPYGPDRVFQYGYRLLDPHDERWTHYRDSQGRRPSFVLLSWGPNKDGSFRQRDELLLYDPTNGAMSPGYLHYFGGYLRPNPAIYDPTDGTIANGIQ